MSQPPDLTAGSDTAGGDYALPAYWPSAWPSLGGRVALSAVFPLVACAVATVVIALTGVLIEAWWVAALPLLLLIAPLSLPSRTRSAIQRAGDRRQLHVTSTPRGLLVRSSRRRRGCPTAIVEPLYDGGFAVSYHVGSVAMTL